MWSSDAGWICRRADADAVRTQGCAQQRQVAGVGERGVLGDLVVRHGPVDPDPQPGMRRSGSVARRLLLDVAHIEGGPLPFPRRRIAVRTTAEEVGDIRALGRWGHVGHRVLVVEALLGPLEVGGHEVDAAAVLPGHDAPGGERAALPDGFDVVDDRNRGVARAQEVAVQRVNQVVRRRGPRGRDKCLRGDLATEDPLQLRVGLAPAEQVEIDLLEVEEVGDFVGGARHAEPLRRRRRGRAGPVRRGSARTAPRSPHPSGSSRRRPATTTRTPRPAGTRRTAAPGPTRPR